MKRAERGERRFGRQYVFMMSWAEAWEAVRTRERERFASLAICYSSSTRLTINSEQIRGLFERPRDARRSLPLGRGEIGLRGERSRFPDPDKGN